MTDTTPEAVERLARVLDGPFYRVEGYAGPYIDEATLRDEHTAAAATLRALLAEIARPRAALPAAQADVGTLIEAARAVRQIVEGIDGAMNHGCWRDDHGRRLKDTPEWVALYVALAKQGGAE